MQVQVFFSVNGKLHYCTYKIISLSWSERTWSIDLDGISAKLDSAEVLWWCRVLLSKLMKRVPSSALMCVCVCVEADRQLLLGCCFVGFPLRLELDLLSPLTLFIYVFLNLVWFVAFWVARSAYMSNKNSLQLVSCINCNHYDIYFLLEWLSTHIMCNRNSGSVSNFLQIGDKWCNQSGT